MLKVKIIVLMSVISLGACGQLSIQIQQPSPNDLGQAEATQPPADYLDSGREAEADNSRVALPASYLSRIVPFPPSAGNKWVVYDNSAHEFAFQYPDRWQLMEIPGESRSMAAASPWADAVQLQNGIYQLMIWFNKTAEDRSFLQAVDAGDRDHIGPFTMLGEGFPIISVRENGVETTILYGDEHFWVGDLHFAIALINLDRGQEAGPDIPPGVKREVEQILGSFVAANVDYTPPGPSPITDDLPCDTVDEASSLWVLCNVRAALISGNLSTLPQWMADPFPLGYWASEWTTRSPGAVVEELQSSRLPQDRTSLTFSNKPEDFPALYGASPERMLGPDVLIEEILYSEGWGQDGYGAALLLFGPDNSGEMILQAIVLSHQHFDK